MMRWVEKLTEISKKQKIERHPENIHLWVETEQCLAGKRKEAIFFNILDEDDRIVATSMHQIRLKIIEENSIGE